MKTLEDIALEAAELGARAERARAELDQLVSECAMPNNIKQVSYLILLSHRGRALEASDDPGCCGIPDMNAHVQQLADPDSWVHSSVREWIKRALREKVSDRTPSPRKA